MWLHLGDFFHVHHIIKKCMKVEKCRKKNGSERKKFYMLQKMDYNRNAIEIIEQNG